MFTGSLRESQQEEITLVDVQGDPLQLLVQYCYTGTIEIREDNVETLLATACLLQLNAVVTACCKFPRPSTPSVQLPRLRVIRRTAKLSNTAQNI